MSTTADFLVEIGTEELPPKALLSLRDAFAEKLQDALHEQRLDFVAAHAYASPRRLAVIVTDLAMAQTDRETEIKGPPVSIAFDSDGNPTPAATAFAKKCGVPIDQLGRRRSSRGEWLLHRSLEAGVAAAELLPACVQVALDALPIPRRMRWGSSDVEFVRPVHWVVLLHGTTVVPGEILGVAAGNLSRGHRFLSPEPLAIDVPKNYVALLRDSGYVLVDFAARRAKIEASVRDLATECGGAVIATDALYEEVTALNEWPVAIAGQFDASFLSLPREVIIATLTGHQRYFSIAGPDGALLPAFITIANLESTDPAQVRAGNERVIRPRLADAAFFWKEDQQEPLSSWEKDLKQVVYQKGLGSLSDKSARVASLAQSVATELGGDVPAVERAALLAKCDLLSGMVGELPELQGVIGRYYALASNESQEVADAIGEQYLPRFAGDTLPVSVVSCSVAIAERLDTLCGIFALGKKPSGSRDPFGLRRCALGLVRIVIERELDLDLKALIALSVGAQGVSSDENPSEAIYAFIVDRMRAYFRDRDGLSAEVFDSVRVRRPDSLLDFDARVRAVAAFVALDSAARLAAANKRIANILRQAGHTNSAAVDVALLGDGAEKTLFMALVAAREDVSPLLNRRDYAASLTRLAELRAPIDNFFADVLVMVEDEKLKRNRLSLLAELRAQFLDVADISRLSIGKE